MTIPTNSPFAVPGYPLPVAQTLDAREAQLRTVIEHSPDVLALVREDRAVEYVSPSVRTMLGHEPSDLLGRDCFELVHPQDLPETLGVFAAAMERPGEPVQRAVRFLSRGGEWRHIEIRAVTLGARSAGARVLLNVRDVTDRVRMLVELAEAKERAEAGEELALLATRARDRVLSVVAHDLRNPLHVVGMYAELLGGTVEADPELAREAALAIASCTERMQRLIEDLLDVSTLQNGTFRLQIRRESVAGLLQEIRRLFAPIALQRGVALEIGTAPAELHADFDRSRTLQVLSNLVGNALRFTGSGGRVRVRARRSDDEVHFVVSDTGGGVPEAQVPHLFSPFRSGPGSEGGLGLGLWIARTLVEAQGGQIRYQPGGGGAQFQFTLPLAAAGP